MRKGKGRVKPVVAVAAACTPGRRPDADGWAWPRPSARCHQTIRGHLQDKRRCSSISRRMRSPPGLRLLPAAAAATAAASDAASNAAAAACAAGGGAATADVVADVNVVVFFRGSAASV